MKRVITRGTMIVGMGLLLLPMSMFADGNPSVNSTDKHFASNAAEGGLAEVELGQMAQKKGSSPSVKDFGQKMVEDHSKAADELKDCARKLGLDLPDHISATAMAEKAKLTAFSGQHFDRAYIDAMVKDHLEDVAAFKREAREGQNPELKRFAAKTLPVLEEHLKMAQRTQRDIGGQASAGEGR
jgi:putative membrane protein